MLIFVAPLSRNFAILGITASMPGAAPTSGSELSAAMEQDFRAGRFGEGMVKAVERVGEVLARHFPRQEGVADEDELPKRGLRGLSQPGQSIDT